MSQELIYKGVIYTYSRVTAPKSKPEYDEGVIVHIINPNTGTRMKKSTKDKNDNTETDISAAHYFRKGEEITKKKLLEEAKKCARKIYTNHEMSILKMLNEHPELGQRTANQLFERYFAEYKKTYKRISISTAKEKERILKKACTNLSEKPVDHITNNDVAKMFNIPGINKNKNEIVRFFDFCRNKNAYKADNPISTFLRDYNVSSAKKSKKLYSKETIHIPENVEKCFHDVMEKHINDAEFMVLPLAKCMGLSMNEILRLTWDSIIILDDHVIIKIKKNNATNMHDFSRPVLKEGSDLILKKRKILLEELNGAEQKLMKMKIVPIKSSKLNKSSSAKNNQQGHLTRYVRTCLLEASMTPDKINEASPNTRMLGGSGMQLLKNQFEYVLNHRCGINLDSAEGKYMRGIIPGDTTNMSYRSLSDPFSGIPYLITIAKRDDLFGTESGSNEKDKIVVREKDKSIYYFPEPGNGEIIKVFASGPVKKGTKIIIENTCSGIKGGIKHVADDYDGKVEVKKIY